VLSRPHYLIAYLETKMCSYAIRVTRTAQERERERERENKYLVNRHRNFAALSGRAPILIYISGTPSQPPQVSCPPRALPHAQLTHTHREIRYITSYIREEIRCTPFWRGPMHRRVPRAAPRPYFTRAYSAPRPVGFAAPRALSTGNTLFPNIPGSWILDLGSIVRIRSSSYSESIR
jgi:hypothetical protein